MMMMMMMLVVVVVMCEMQKRKWHIETAEINSADIPARAELVTECSATH